MSADATLTVPSVPLAALHPMWLALAVLAPIAWYVARRYGHRPRWALPLAVAAVVVGGVLGSGVVEIPSFEDLPLQEWVEDVGAALGHWAYAIVGVLAFVETGAFVGLVAPGETFVILGGVLAGEGTLDYVVLLGIVWACAFSGDLASFLLGRRLGRAFLVKHGPRFKITPDRLAKVEVFFEKHGGKAVLIGRFIGFVRAVAPFVLGSGGVTLRRFVPYSILGSGLWATLFVTLGYLFWQSLDQILAWAHQGAVWFGALIAVVVGVYVVLHWLGVEENRVRAHGWLEQARQTRAGRVVLVVWRPLSLPLRFAWKRVTPGDLGLEVTTLAAIGAVGAFVFFAYERALDAAVLTGTDRELLRWVDRLSIDAFEELSRIGTALGSVWAVGALTLIAAAFLVYRRHIITAVTLVIGTVAVQLTVAAVRSADDRVQPPGAMDVLDASSFPSPVAAGAVIWVAVSVCLSPAVRRIPGRIGLTGLALILGVAICAAPIVRRSAYLSDVLGGAGLAAAVFALVGVGGVVVRHLRQTPSR
ncbi:MAG: VTT domain-containing protein [Solirubrobacteraceae bacterium]